MSQHPMRRPPVSQVRAARDSHSAGLLAIPNVVGTAIGEIVTDNQSTGNRGLIVFVDRKVPKSKLVGAGVPKRIRSGRASIATDVVELAGLRQQFGSAPFYCSDGLETGIVTSISASRGEFVAVTCAHCIKGPDLDPFTVDRMQIFHPASRGYIDVGQSDYAIYGRGRGVQGDFGFSDAGIFTLDDDEILGAAKAAQTMKVWDSVRTNTKVWMETGHSTVFGVVHAIEATFAGIFADVCVRMADGGTYKGDSGGLWRTETGLAVAVHALGSGARPGYSSEYSFGMFAHRVEKLLDVEFLDL